jgi:alanine racemase
MHGLRSPLLVLGEANRDELQWGAAHDVTFSLNDLEAFERWRSLGVPVRFHCNVDTGMGRLGLSPVETARLAQELAEVRDLSCAGVYTHFACADHPGTSSIDTQHRGFEQALQAFARSGIDPGLVHCANSAALLQFPDKHYPGVRAGIMLYGCKPDPRQEFGAELAPVASLKGRVVKIKHVPAGTTVSYGWNYTAPENTTIATIALGYGQGLPRLLTGSGEILIGAERYRIAGNVTMDYVMIDAGAEPRFEVGAEAVAIGSQGEEHITADDIACRCGTIGYEVLCNLGTDIERRYYFEGKLYARQDGISI